MKRQIRKILQLSAVVLFTVGGFTSCNDVDDEIFDDIDSKIQHAIDEEDEKKQKPKGKT